MCVCVCVGVCVWVCVCACVTIVFKAYTELHCYFNECLEASKFIRLTLFHSYWQIFGVLRIGLWDLSSIQALCLQNVTTDTGDSLQTLVSHHRHWWLTTDTGGSSQTLVTHHRPW